MNTDNMKSPFVRVGGYAAIRGLKKLVNDTDVNDENGKLVPPELFRRIKKLGQDHNNLLNGIKKLFDSSFYHPQGGVVTLADEPAGTMPTLWHVFEHTPKATKKNPNPTPVGLLPIAKEAAAIQAEISRLISSGEWDDWLAKVPGITGRPKRTPSVRCEVTIAVDTRNGQNFADIKQELENRGLWFPEVTPVVLIPRQDEKLVEILENIAEKMSKAYGPIAAKLRDPSQQVTVTKEDILKKNNTLAHSLDGEREKFRAILGPGPQTDQVDALIDKLLGNCTDIVDVFEEVKLFDGAPASEAVDVRKYLAHNIKDDDAIADFEPDEI